MFYWLITSYIKRASRFHMCMCMCVRSYTVNARVSAILTKVPLSIKRRTQNPGKLFSAASEEV